MSKPATVLMAIIPIVLAAPSPTRAQDDAPSVIYESMSRSIELTDQGGKDRQQLRYRFRDGESARYRIEALMTIDMTVEGQKIPNEIPSQFFYEITMDAERNEEDGSATLWLTLNEAGVRNMGERPTFEEMMFDAFAEDQIGTRFRLSVRENGDYEQIELFPREGLPEQEHPSMVQWDRIMSQLFQFLPDEPVGAGASWAVRQPQSVRGAAVDCEMTVSLDELTGSGWVITSQITQSARNQFVKEPIPMNLEELIGKGRSELTVDTSSGLPVSAFLNTATTFSAQAEYGGKQFEMKCRMNQGANINRVQNAEDEAGPGVEAAP